MIKLLGLVILCGGLVGMFLNALIGVIGLTLGLLITWAGEK